MPLGTVLVALIDLAFITSLVKAAIAVSRQPDTKEPGLSLPSFATLVASSIAPQSTKVLKVRCDGDFYGRNLNVASCRDVFDFMPKNDTQNVYADRHARLPMDIPLPMRTMGDDGKCFAQPVLASGVTSGRASLTELGQAAYNLLHVCVIRRGIGGIAAQVGGDDNMRMIIANYQPNVRCDKGSTPGPPFHSCFHVFADMEASPDVKVFGNRGEPRVQVSLPVVYKAIDARCMIRLGINGKATSSSWYEIWEAVMAIFSMCVRAKKKGGKAYHIGLRRNIILELSDNSPDSFSTAGDSPESNLSSLYDWSKAPVTYLSSKVRGDMLNPFPEHSLFTGGNSTDVSPLSDGSLQVA